jgi:uncharacterized protein YkuJ
LRFSGRRRGFFRFWEPLMQRITIEIADDGRVTVMAENDGEEPQTMDFESAGEALEAVGAMLEPAEAEMEAMWDEEAARRPAQPTMMA